MQRHQKPWTSRPHRCLPVFTLAAGVSVKSGDSVGLGGTHTAVSALPQFTSPPFPSQELAPRGYVHVNQDELKSKARCIKVASEALAAGKSVAIDRTNPSVADRREWIALARKSANRPVPPLDLSSPSPLCCIDPADMWNITKHGHTRGPALRVVLRIIKHCSLAKEAFPPFVSLRLRPCMPSR